MPWRNPRDGGRREPTTRQERLGADAAKADAVDVRSAWEGFPISSCECFLESADCTRSTPPALRLPPGSLPTCGADHSGEHGSRIGQEFWQVAIKSAVRGPQPEMDSLTG